MVGLPNRAGRCKICLRGKIKCDHLRPSCSRCQRMGFSCEYVNPQRGQVFINRNINNPFVKAADVFSNADKKALPQFPKKPCRRQTKPPCVRNNQNMQVTPRISESPNPDLLNRMQLLSTFIWVYLPEVAQGPTKSGLTPASWVHTLPDLTVTNSAYNKSLAALCVAQLGAWNHNPVLVKESLQLYGSALVELRKAISSRELLAREATLASIVILSTYEVFSGSSERDNGWASHVRGASRALQFLGSTIHESPVGRQLSARIRTIVIFEAFRTRKASILAGLNWQRLALEPESPDLYRDIQDIMIQIPPILESLDMFITNANKSVKKAILIQSLLTCSNLDKQLLAWYENLRKQVHGPLYWSLPSAAQSPADDPVLGPVFPAAFHFPRLSVTQLLLLYWSTQILLYRTIQDTRRKLKSCASDLDGMIKNSLISLDFTGAKESWFNQSCPSNESISVLAKNICQSFEYCYRAKSGTLGPQSTVFPLWVAQDFYASQPHRGRELAWCSEIGNMTAPESRFDLHVGSRWT